jgi:hypothetical protein
LEIDLRYQEEQDFYELALVVVDKKMNSKLRTHPARVVLEEIRLEGLDYDLKRIMNKIREMLKQESAAVGSEKVKKYSFGEQFVQTVRREQLHVPERGRAHGLDEQTRNQDLHLPPRRLHGR